MTEEQLKQLTNTLRAFIKEELELLVKERFLVIDAKFDGVNTHINDIEFKNG